MVFLEAIRLVFKILFINASSGVDMISEITKVGVESNLKKDKYMESQLYKAYNFLSNLGIISYKCSQDEFFHSDLVDSESEEYFLRIGILPQYLHTDNFKDIISLQKFTLYYKTEEMELFSCDDACLMANGNFMGFKIQKFFYNKLSKLIAGSVFFKSVEIRIKINEKIDEFTVLIININEDGTIITSTNTMSSNKGLSFLEYFPVSSRNKDNNHFLAFMIYTINQLDAPIIKTHKLIANVKMVVYMLTIIPPMFVYLRAFRQDMIFVYGTRYRKTKIFPKLKTKIYPYPFYTLDYIVYDFISDSNTFDIGKYIYTNNFAYNSPIIGNYTACNNERKTYIKIKKSILNIWSINVKTICKNCNLKKLNSIIFLFKKGRRKACELKFDFDSKEVISEKEVMHSLIIENPTGRLLIILNALKEIIDKGEGNIVFHFLEENEIQQTFAICFNNGNSDIIIFRQLRKFPVTLLPKYPSKVSIK